MNPTFPFDLRNIYIFLRSDTNKENGKNEDFTPLAERTVHGNDATGYSNDASPDSQFLDAYSRLPNDSFTQH